MLPRLAPNNSSNSRNSNAELAGQFGTRHTGSVSSSNLNNIRGSELGSRHSLTSDTTVLSLTVVGVVLRCPKEQMLRIEAARVVAAVENVDGTVEIEAKKQVSGQTVDIGAAVVDTDTPVRKASEYDSASPQPASGDWINVSLMKQFRQRIFVDETASEGVGGNLARHGTNPLVAGRRTLARRSGVSLSTWGIVPLKGR